MNTQVTINNTINDNSNKETSSWVAKAAVWATIFGATAGVLTWLQIQPPSNQPDLAPFWQDVKTREVVQITRKGEDIFQKGLNTYSNGGVPFDRTFECRTHRNGNRWLGDCTYLYKTEDGRQCWVKTEEVLISVDKNRIEGKSQGIEAPKRSGECPVPGAEWSIYSLQPKS